MFARPSKVRFALGVVLLPSLFACYGGEPEPTSLVAPMIASFYATPSTVGRNQATELSWVVRDATSLHIDTVDGAEVLAPTTDLSGHTTTARLAEDTRFVLTASNGTRTSTATVFVRVEARAASASIESFTATPSIVSAGAGTTIAWTTSGAKRGVVRRDGAVVRQIPAAELASGSVAVRAIDARTTFELVVAGADEIEASSSVVVDLDLGPLPGITSFAPLSPSITAGDSTTLSWVVADATDVTVSGPTSGVVYSGSSLAGSVSVRPLATETFTLTAVRGGRTATSMATITVVPPNGARILSFAAGPTSVRPFGRSTLSWEVVNASGGIEISDGTFVIFRSRETTGTFVVTPLETTSYQLRAIDPSGDSTASVTVTVAVPGLPQIAVFSASDDLVARNGTTVLSWRTIDASTVHIYANGTRVYATTTDAAVGSYTATVTDLSTSYVLVASNITGSNTFTIHVTAHDRPLINSFTVTPPFVNGSGTVTLAWNVASASHLEITANGAPLPGFTTIDTSPVAGPQVGTFAVAISQTTTFELVARSAAGEARRTVVATSALAVSELEPNDTSTTASPATGGLVTAALDPAGDVDYFAITVPAGATVVAETSGASGACTLDTLLALIDVDGNGVLESNDDIDYPANPCSRIDGHLSRYARDLAAGTYYLRVSSYVATATGAYALTVAVEPAACGDGIVQLEAAGIEECDDGNTVSGDGCSAACAIEVNPTVVTYPGATLTLNLPSAGAFAVVEVDVGAAGRAIAAIAGDVGGTTCNGVQTAIELTDDVFTPLGVSLVGGRTGTAGECAAILYPTARFATNLANGIYYLVVSSQNGATGTVQLDVTIHDAVCGNGLVEGRAGETCDDGNTSSGDGCSATCALETPVLTETEPNDLPATAFALGTLIAPATTDPSGAINPATDRDLYQFTLTATASVVIATYGTPGQVDASCPDDTQLFLYHGAPADLDATTSAEEPTLVEYDDDDGYDYCSWIGGSYSAPVPLVLPAGTYYVQVRSYELSYVIPTYYLHVAVTP